VLRRNELYSEVVSALTRRLIMTNKSLSHLLPTFLLALAALGGCDDPATPDEERAHIITTAMRTPAVCDQMLRELSASRAAEHKIHLPSFLGKDGNLELMAELTGHATDQIRELTHNTELSMPGSPVTCELEFAVVAQHDEKAAPVIMRRDGILLDEYNGPLLVLGPNDNHIQTWEPLSEQKPSGEADEDGENDVDQGSFGEGMDLAAPRDPSRAGSYCLVYEHKNYQGSVLSIDYPFDYNDFHRKPNFGGVSSIKCFGKSLVLFDDSQWNAASMTVTAGAQIADLHNKNFGDRTSSVRWQEVNPGGNCRLYEHKSYEGKFLTVTNGTDWNDLHRAVGMGWGDKVSSVSCTPGVVVFLCKNDQWDTCQVFQGSDADLHDNGLGDTISSVSFAGAKSSGDGGGGGGGGGGGTSYTNCGISCPNGWHVENIKYTGSCGPLEYNGVGNGYDNSVTCAPNTTAFWQCGIFCPAGWHGTQFNSNVSCGWTNGSNHAYCTK
jgi:hypothetical protein